MMDVVIAYVNGNDRNWQRSYAAAIGGRPTPERFRDWGTLPYLLRGIAGCIPFVRKVHLIVSDEGQVPVWIDRQQVHVVLHKDIIPARFLPLFNSSCIELFLHDIPGLAERFVYFNDDMFVLKACTRDDFFPEGKPRVWVRPAPMPSPDNVFRMTCRNASDMAFRLAGITAPGDSILKPQHAPSPMLTSVNREVYSRARKEILASITPLRTSRNFNQYLYLDYYWVSGTGYRSPHDFAYLELKDGVHTIDRAIRAGLQKLVCVNDKGCQDFMSAQKRILSAFAWRFPDKSRYEL